MHPELTQAGPAGKRRLMRVDGARVRLAGPGLQAWAVPLLAVMAIAFVLVGAGNLVLGPADARLGLAAGEPLGPLGQVYGSWSPELWPGRVAASRIATLFEEGGRTTPASVLWPAALAAVAIGWTLARRMMAVMGLRAGLWVGLCWFGCLGVIDHSGGTGLEFLSGLATVAAIDRLLAHGSDWRAGVWAALAFLSGGWPPVVLILLAVIVIGRREASFSARLVVPPLAAVFAWSFWAISSASTEAWAAAMALPFTQRPDWWLAPRVLGLGLPFAPFAILSLSRSLRQNWSGAGRPIIVGWLQAALACLIAGTIVPGLSQAARVPALAGILFAAAAGLDAAWVRSLLGPARRTFLALVFGLLSVWLIILLYGSYLWLLVFPYYRPVGIAAVLVSVPALVLGWLSVETANTRRGLVALVALTISLKLVHWGYYVPEWNYRHGQVPWGRAVGQWLLPNWTVYTFHDWSPDLAFAIGRPVRQLRSPQHLAYPATGESKHVLLLESEFDHWPADAPHLLKVAAFHDQFGGRRVLARTEGVLLTPSGVLYSDDANR
jgi:hypothetical protein